MPDVVATKLLPTGARVPKEHKVLLRENMDGADAVDRQRRRRRDDYEEDGEDTWGASSEPAQNSWSSWFDPWTAWFHGCVEVGHVAQGCNHTCPFCTNPVYEAELDRIPLTYWTSQTEECEQEQLLQRAVMVSSPSSTLSQWDPTEPFPPPFSKPILSIVSQP